MFTIRVVVVSIVRISILMAMPPADITCTPSPTTFLLLANASIVTEYGFATWSVVEVSMGILSACLPVMRPLLGRFVRPTVVEESHTTHITHLPASWNGTTAPEQHADTDMQQQFCRNTNCTTKPAAPQRLHSNESVMSVKQWRDPENIHPGDLCHVYNSSHGTAMAFKSGGVKALTATTPPREVRYGLWPAD